MSTERANKSIEEQEVVLNSRNLTYEHQSYEVKEVLRKKKKKI